RSPGKSSLSRPSANSRRRLRSTSSSSVSARLAWSDDVVSVVSAIFTSPCADGVVVVPRCISHRLIRTRILGQARGDFRIVDRGLVVDRLEAQVEFMYGSFLGGRGTTGDALVDAIHGIRRLPFGAGIGDRNPSRATGVHGHPLRLLTT